jgi:hypothetical protein
MNRGVTQAGCLLALLCFARVASGQGIQTAAAVGPPVTTASALPASDQIPAVPPKISYVGGQLSIRALGSTLADVLTQVAALTGVKIDVPAGANTERMPIVELGPGPARQILADLLSDSNFDYLIQASDADPEKLQAVLLMPREKKTDAPGRASRGPYMAAATPPESPVPDTPVPPQPEIAPPQASSLNPAAALQADPSTQPPPAPPDLSGQPLLQPDTSNPAKPGALAPPATLSPQSINQQLQQMYQQRAQMTQQDHYTGTQPLPPIPGAK